MSDDSALPADPFRSGASSVGWFENGGLLVNQLLAMKAKSELEAALGVLSLADRRGAIVAIAARQHQLAMDDEAFDAWLRGATLELPDETFRELPTDFANLEASFELVERFFALPSLGTVIRAVDRVKYDSLYSVLLLLISAQLVMRLGPEEWANWASR